jgi:membrane protease YdiL (CAAX protease family)
METRVGRASLLVVVGLVLTFSYTFVALLVPDTTPRALLVRTGVWTAAALAGYAAYRAARRRSLRPLWRLGQPAPPRIAALTAAVALVGVAICVPPYDRSHLDLIRIAVIGVAGEEALFRGLLWDITDDLVPTDTEHARVGFTLGVTTALFALNHLQYAGFSLDLGLAAQLGYTAVAGLVLGLLRLRTGGLVWPILAHGAGNAVLQLLHLLR